MIKLRKVLLFFEEIITWYNYRIDNIYKEFYEEKGRGIF